MVFVKVRETYDLHTEQNKMTVIGIHTPNPSILKSNYPGLLMQCRAYRPVSADVRLACASVQPLDPLSVGTSPGDVAPEDVFNPILYKAMSNKGMSQLDARINAFPTSSSLTPDVDGALAFADVDDLTNVADEFDIYYGLLANTHDWKHASIQSGLSMTGLRPYVYEFVYNVGDQKAASANAPTHYYPVKDGTAGSSVAGGILGDAKPFPFINCTSYTLTSSASSADNTGFQANPRNCEQDVPWLKVFCGCIIIPPSRLHSFYMRMVVEWNIEFTGIRPISEITSWSGLAQVGAAQHFQNYSYSSAKEALTGTSESVMNSDACMVSANTDVTKVM